MTEMATLSHFNGVVTTCTLCSIYIGFKASVWRIRQEDTPNIHLNWMPLNYVTVYHRYARIVGKHISHNITKWSRLADAEWQSFGIHQVLRMHLMHVVGAGTMLGIGGDLTFITCQTCHKSLCWEHYLKKKKSIQQRQKDYKVLKIHRS